LEGTSPVAASPPVTAEALRIALDAASSDSPGAARQQADASALEHARSDRPARGRVCTLGRITPAAARRAAASAAHAAEVEMGPTSGLGVEEATQRGGLHTGGKRSISRGSQPPLIPVA
jgi:hypothetical protein